MTWLAAPVNTSLYTTPPMGFPRCNQRLRVSFCHLDSSLVEDENRIREKGKEKSGTHEVGTVGVHLASGIVSKDVDGSLVDESDSLDIIRSPHKLHALQGTSRN